MRPKTSKRRQATPGSSSAGTPPRTTAGRRSPTTGSKRKAGSIPSPSEERRMRITPFLIGAAILVAACSADTGPTDVTATALCTDNRTGGGET